MNDTSNKPKLNLFSEVNEKINKETNSTEKHKSSSAAVAGQTQN